MLQCYNVKRLKSIRNGRLGFPDLSSGQKPCWKLELIFNPCGEFRRNTESPVGQTHSPHHHDGAPGIFSDLLRSVQMLKSGVRNTTGSYRTHSSLVKLQPWFLSLWWKTCLWTELQHWCLSLQ